MRKKVITLPGGNRGRVVKICAGYAMVETEQGTQWVYLGRTK